MRIPMEQALDGTVLRNHATLRIRHGKNSHENATINYYTEHPSLSIYGFLSSGSVLEECMSTTEAHMKHTLYAGWNQQ